MTGIILKNIKKSFGNTLVIKDINLTIAAGEFCVFVGPSGCGKSTLLRMIAGLEEISNGDIYIGNTCVNDINATDRGVAMVFQTYALYPHMTVAQNMAFGLKMTKHPKAVINERVSRAAKTLQLLDQMNQKPKELSGGQRQRVAIGRAIVRNPNVFLFDEPLSNLDAELRVAMRVELSRLHKTLSRSTMIYVTHDQVEAMTLADKIVVLKDGKVEQSGMPLDVYDNPDNLFVAGFIGSPQMNFLKAKIIKCSSKKATLELPDYSNISFSVNIKNNIGKIGDKITLGIRPEHFKDSGEIGLPCKVDVAEHLGATSFIHALSCSGEKLVIQSQHSRSATTGKDYLAKFNASSIYLFNNKGERLR